MFDSVNFPIRRHIRNKPTETKRAKISKAQRVTLVEVLAASLVLGACIVIANFLIKYIKFNTLSEHTTNLHKGICHILTHRPNRNHMLILKGEIFESVGAKYN